MIKTLPITLITGYLGSGKTTLINYLLNNTKNNKVAVIVNDIGEINIDEKLIEKGGIVNSKDNNLVALSNGCICCTLKEDLIKQLADLVNSNKFDHIFIEASGICEPIPIAQTITYMQQEFIKRKMPEFYKIDSIISVCDALRLKDEFSLGEILLNTERGEENIENLVIQQIEFCNIVLLNKVSELNEKEKAKVIASIRAIQPEAKIIETDYCKVEINEILDTNLFDFDKVGNSAAWIKAFNDDDNEVESEHVHEEEHEHHHHHHENGVDKDDDEGTAEEYDIQTWVYFRRKPFNKLKFDEWLKKDYGRNIIRTKGLVYFTYDIDSAYIYEQAGKQKVITDNGRWYVSILSKKEIDHYLKTNEEFKKMWDPDYGDRMIKLVFIGQDINKKALREELDNI